MKMQHSFNINVACKYGILEAVLLTNIYFWVEKNAANEKHEHDGKYWTYNSVEAFAKLFPYASKDKVRRALDHLRNEGVLETGNFNKSAYDRTLWYTITDKGLASMKDSDYPLANLPNQFNDFAKPIPDIKQDNKQEDNSYIDESISSMLPSALNMQLRRIFKVKGSQQSRKTRINAVARLQKEFSDEDILKAATVCSSQKPIQTRDGKEWRPNYLWFTEPSNFESVAKVIEYKTYETETEYTDSQRASIQWCIDNGYASSFEDYEERKTEVWMQVHDIEEWQKIGQGYGE